MIHSWYRWFIGKDFFDTLNTYGKLPLEMNLKSLMDTIKENDDFKAKE